MVHSVFLKEKRKTKHPSFLPLSLSLVCILLLFFPTSCHYYKLERQLDPENAEFLSKVRYIITKKEKRIFLELPDSEKEEFKEEFWERRDPDPSTEENEFKMEYFNRIEKANDMFLSEGKAGWMTDRGRIYILFGQPTERRRDPAGRGICQEIWYYGYFPIVFVDRTCTGDYQLVTYDLTPLSAVNLRYLHELSGAQKAAQQTIIGENIYFDFDWDIKKTLVETDRIEGVITIEIPYASIWFKEEDEKLKTTLDLHLELKDSEGKLMWEYDGPFEIETDEQEIEENRKKKYHMEVPFRLEKDLDLLRKGKNQFLAILKNRTGEDEMKKVREFNL